MSNIHTRMHRTPYTHTRRRRESESERLTDYYFYNDNDNYLFNEIYLVCNGYTQIITSGYVIKIFTIARDDWD